MDSERRNCNVKIIVNPQTSKAFALRYDLAPKKVCSLKITIPNVADLNSIIEEIKKQLPIKFNFNINFNWNNVPKEIVNDKKFKEDILRIFQHQSIEQLVKPTVKQISNIESTTENILYSENNTRSFSNDDIGYERLASMLIMHVKNYGAAPDFRNVFTAKNKEKVHNYIKSALGLPSLTQEQSSIIGNLATKDLYKS